MSEKNRQLRLLVLIMNPKLTRSAEKVFREEKLPITLYSHGLGTASNEFMDILGLGMPAKGICVLPVPRVTADRVLRRLRRMLGLGSANSGIAFTIPVDATNQLTLDLTEHLESERKLPRRGENGMTQESTYTMIGVLVNRGYNNEVMKAARTAGAAGGTVIHCRHAGDSDILNRFGLELQEEKEIVLIVAEREKKQEMMTAVSQACGVKTDAQGIILSVPIDQVIGIGEFFA